MAASEDKRDLLGLVHRRAVRADINVAEPLRVQKILGASDQALHRAMAADQAQSRVPPGLAPIRLPLRDCRDCAQLQPQIVPADPAVRLLGGDLGATATANQIRAVEPIESAAAVESARVRVATYI
ncbi:hypothetical protein GCM10027521_60610 [Amycolatopsis cihanbeyliensis]